MNRCHVFKELSSYLDDQLNQDQKIKVEEHLKSCSLCAQELSRLKRLSEKLKAWQIADLDSGFDSLVQKEIVAQELERGAVKMKKKNLAILIPSGVLAGMLLVVFMFNGYVKHGFQGKIRYSEDSMAVEQGKKSTVRSYEPYYLESNFDNIRGDSELEDYKTGVGVSNNRYNAARRIDSLKQARVRDQQMDLAVGREAYEGEYNFKPESELAPAGEGAVIVIQPVLPATGQGEKIIRTAEIKLEVADGQLSYKKASEICQNLGGYLGASRFYKDAEGRESGTITMRIPKDKFLTAMDQLSALGKVENVSNNSQDVSQEYANLNSRLDAVMVVYKKMLEALQKRQATIPDALRMESELTPILSRIEDLKNKIEYLNNAVSFTTITVTFHEPKVSVKVLNETKLNIQKGILTAKINAVNFFANIVPNLIGIVIAIVVLLTLAFLVKYFVVRLFKRQ